VKRYKKKFSRFFKTDLSGEKWCWQKRSTIHKELVKKGDSHAVLIIIVSSVISKGSFIYI